MTTTLLWSDYAGGQYVAEIFDYTTPGGTQLWEIPEGVTKLDMVIIIGGGAGGMAGNGSTGIGGVGGGGGQVRVLQNVVFNPSGTTSNPGYLEVHVGYGGTGGVGATADHDPGDDGGYSDFKDGYCREVAAGGEASTTYNVESKGGGKKDVADLPLGSIGGSAGGNGGIYKEDGEPCPGFGKGGTANTSADYWSGCGGGSYSKGANNSFSDGIDGVQPGGYEYYGSGASGGGAGVLGNTAYDGGDGATGRVIFVWRQ